MDTEKFASFLHNQERQEDLKIAMDAPSHLSPRTKATIESLDRAKRELSSHCDAIKLSLANLNRANEWQFNESNPTAPSPNESLNGSFKSGEFSIFYKFVLPFWGGKCVEHSAMSPTTCCLIACSISNANEKLSDLLVVLHAI